MQIPCLEEIIIENSADFMHFLTFFRINHSLEPQVSNQEPKN